MSAVSRCRQGPSSSLSRGAPRLPHTLYLQPFDETLRIADCVEDPVDAAHAMVEPSVPTKFSRIDIGEMPREVRGFGSVPLLGHSLRGDTAPSKGGWRRTCSRLHPDI